MAGPTVIRNISPISPIGLLNLGFDVNLNSPGDGDLLIDIKQGDNVSDPVISQPTVVGFLGTPSGLLLETVDSLKLDSSDHLGLDYPASGSNVAYPPDTAQYLALYAIDRAGTLVWGISRRFDYTRATSDFVNTEGTAITRDHVFCSASVTAGDICRVVYYFQATYTSSGNDWDSLLTNSGVIGPIDKHPLEYCQARVSFDGTGAFDAVTIFGAFNVASVTDNATGNYTVAWETDFSDTNYSIVGATVRAGGGAMLVGGTKAVGSSVISITSDIGSSVDGITVDIVVFGGQ